jgi:HK97 family phage portal protein
VNVLDLAKKRWLRLLSKAAPKGLAGGLPGRYPFADAFRRRAQPGARELLDSLRGFTWACANINAQAVASVPGKLYVRTNKSESPTRWPTRPVAAKTLEYLRRESPCAAAFISKSADLKEATDHPLLKLFKNANPWMNRFDLFRLLVMDIDGVDGAAYWYPAKDRLGVPREIWPLECWRMRPVPAMDSDRIIQSFEYMGARGTVTYEPDELIQFRHASPHDFYVTGYSASRAAFEYIALLEELIAFESAIVGNRARPDLLISPTEPISRAMAQRLEARFTDRFRRGGAGGVLVGEHDLRYTPFQFSPADLSAMEIRKECQEIIAACFQVPLSLVKVEDVNRANADAGHYQHARQAVKPRCDLIEQKINERLVPLYDERFLFAFDNPVPEDRAERRSDRQVNMGGVPTHTINHERAQDGLPPLVGKSIDTQSASEHLEELLAESD